MSLHVETVHAYLDGFRNNDHEQILSCLTDDVEWAVFGAFRLTGKEAYDAALDGRDPSGPAGGGRRLVRGRGPRPLRVMFAVEDIDDTLARLVRRGLSDPRCEGSRSTPR